MKIAYNVLWLDDQIDAFIDDEFVEKVETHLKEEGFNPNIITVSKPDDFFAKLNDSFDLILTDYHMAGKNGDEVVNEIRAKSIHTEILFYTAKADLKDTGKINRVSFLQTESLSGTHHENVVNEVINLINLTIKKFQHIVAMRGMIMHETSYLDAQSQEILKSYIVCEDGGCDKCTQKEKCTPISDAIFEKLISHLAEKTEKANKKNLKKLMSDSFLFSADYKALALQKISEAFGVPDFSEGYKTEIIKVRNQFAHAVLEKDEEHGRDFFKDKNEGVTFDEALCKTIRKNINKHKENLDDLQSKI